jgi:dTDP-glucose 4,6-dehydratase
MRILITGGAGFIGSNFIRYILKNYPNYKLINVDKLTYAGNIENLNDIKDYSNYEFIHGDISDKGLINSVVDSSIDAIINFAAESHVDRSIEDSYMFVKTNILGVQTLLNAARFNRVKRFIQISTDEVYGSIDSGSFSENSPIFPRSPYSATKGGADLLCQSYFITYKLPIIITRSSNNYGPYQFPEKFIPLIITNAIENREIPVYGDGLNIRDWLYVEDNCKAIDCVLHKGKDGEIYNIAGNCEMKNIDVVKFILKELGKSDSLIRFVSDRLGHDRRYSIDFSKMKEEFGWEPICKFEDGIRLTIDWYIENKPWWAKIKNKEYMDYYTRMYGDR